MRVEFDHGKRDKTLAERALDFSDAAEVFAGLHFTDQDHRQVYAEPRFNTIGPLAQRLIVIVWTPRGQARRIISMRKANDRQQLRYASRLG